MEDGEVKAAAQIVFRTVGKIIGPGEKQMTIRRKDVKEKMGVILTGGFWLYFSGASARENRKSLSVKY